MGPDNPEMDEHLDYLGPRYYLDHILIILNHILDIGRKLHLPILVFTWGRVLKVLTHN